MKKILVLVLALLLTTQCLAATGWVKTKPAGSLNPGQIDDAIGENNAALDLLLSGYQTCKLTYSTAAQVTVTPGAVMVSDVSGGTRLMLANTAAVTVTWADIDTGGEEASTTYYVYAIASATTDTTFTCKVTKSATSPSGVTYYKKIGSFYNDGSSNITIVADGTPGVTNTATAITGANYGATSLGEYYYLCVGVDSTGTTRTITGYASTGTAIPLPTDCTQANSWWIVSMKMGKTAGYAWYGYSIAIDSSRIVTINSYGINWVG